MGIFANQQSASPMTGMLDRFMQGKQFAQQARMEKATRELMPQAMAGDPQAMQQLMGVNPNAGMQIQGMMMQQQQRAQQAEQFAQTQQLNQRRLGLQERQMDADEAALAAGPQPEYKTVGDQLYKIMPGQDPVKVAGDSKEAKDIRKETRGSIDKGLTGISTATNVILNNRDKLENLAGEIQKGNRAAVAQGLVSLVKLNDPNSAVLEGEMRSALNQKDPIAAVTQLLTDKGTSSEVQNAVLNSLDPLRPDAVNVKDLLSAADAMISANVPTLLDDYAGLQERGETLTEGGRRALFTKSLQSKMDRLRGYVQTPEVIPPSPPVTQDTVTQLSDEELAARLAAAQQTQGL